MEAGRPRLFSAAAASTPDVLAVDYAAAFPIALTSQSSGMPPLKTGR
jgi:hypothetical protein